MRRLFARLSVLVFLPAAAVLAQAAVAGSPLAAPAAAPAAPAGASASRIRADVEWLAAPARKGRLAGSPEADETARWLAARFETLGLAPAGTGGTYLQAFEFIDGVDLGPGNALTTTARAPLGRVWSAGSDFGPLPFAAAGAVEADVVFAGYGITAPELSHDDYAGVDVKGKVVIVLRYGPDGDDPQSPFSPYHPLRHKASLARDHGAVGLLAVAGPRTHGISDELVRQRGDASFTDAGLAAFTVRRSVVEALLSASGKTLDAAQKAIGARRPASFAVPGAGVRLTVDLLPRRSRASNVLALLPSTVSSEVVVVGAHYDHLGMGGSHSLEPTKEPRVHAGADDNGSGTAGLLEVARLLAGRASDLKRSILFIAFSGEEEGTLGSIHFLKKPTVPADRIVAMVNLDMIGRLRNDTLELHGVGTSPVWNPLIEKANAATKLTLKLHPGGFGPSDHSPFYTARKPVLFAFTGLHADYHRASDTAEKIDAAGEARILDLLEPVVLGVLTADVAPAFTAVAPPAKGDRDRPRATVVGERPGGDRPGEDSHDLTPGSRAE